MWSMMTCGGRQGVRVRLTVSRGPRMSIHAPPTRTPVRSTTPCASPARTRGRVTVHPGPRARLWGMVHPGPPTRGRVTVHPGPRARLWGMVHPGPPTRGRVTVHPGPRVRLWGMVHPGPPTRGRVTVHPGPRVRLWGMVPRGPRVGTHSGVMARRGSRVLIRVPVMLPPHRPGTGRGSLIRVCRRWVVRRLRRVPDRLSRGPVRDCGTILNCDCHRWHLIREPIPDRRLSLCRCPGRFLAPMSESRPRVGGTSRRGPTDFRSQEAASSCCSAHSGR
ncbi:hypothetical protein H4W81_006141 [Nonomuraea africana]|uniref:Uncharacterized protein n=1 Tax=Nonomuraea africana TaxID=46171 RepID=A0ABR9KMV8_9ACTN|nr:hypothetical protein [Nonomuraea africana]